MPLLSNLIELPAHPLISIVGAGGKTTTMYTLANELATKGRHILTTTTTNIFPPKKDETDTLLIASEIPALLTMICTAWKQYSRITVAGTAIEGGKLAGLQPEQPYELLIKSGADVVIVEADGARHRMIKAPAEHEPVIPTYTNVALLMMSAEAINRPLNAVVAHRPERIAAVVGMNQGEILTPARIAYLMTSEQGALKHIPETAATYLLITHVSEELKAVSQEIAALVRPSPRIRGVYYSAQPGTWFALH